MSGSGFRPNVAAILRRSDGCILLGERSDRPGAWQFPQGGVNEGEDLQAALRRELEEEIGLVPQDYEVVACRGGYRYRFPDGVRKGDWAGQEQTYFLCRLRDEGAAGGFRLDGAEPEFSRVAWMEPAAFRLAWLPEFKREVYQRVFRDLLGTELT